MKLLPVLCLLCPACSTASIELGDEGHSRSPFLLYTGDTGISRKTGYKIFDRYQECGIQGSPTEAGVRIPMLTNFLSTTS